MSGQDDAEQKRHIEVPYGAKHPIPTISRFRKEKASRQENALNSNVNADQREREDGIYRAGHGATHGQQNDQDEDDNDDYEGDNQDSDAPQDTSQVDSSATDPRQRRKQMKSNKRERAEREVTDPVTHLPIIIHDFTDEALEEVDVNDPQYGSTKRTATGMDGKRKPDEQLRDEKQYIQREHDALKSAFPPPEFDALRQEMANISKRGVTLGLSGAAIIISTAFALERMFRKDMVTDGKVQVTGTSAWLIVLGLGAAAVWALIIGVRDWIAKKVNGVFQDEIWDAQRDQIKKQSKKHQEETTVWLNSLLGAVWPLINPDLFTSLADTLEDVMQASLPRFIRMVSVDDIGQGSESLRILGIRWLPTGAAAQSVTEDGNLTKEEQNGNTSKDKGVPQGDADSGQSEEKDDDGNNKSGDAIAEGMAAEEGDFVNLEIAFAYRTRSSSKTLKERTKDMHLYVAFYLPGNIKVPVWVDLQGVIGIMRLRLQLTPDPPFFALCTMTFLGQPKVNLSCVPLSKHALNIMDVPFISNFVQSSVDAAMAEYVAPKSLTLDLKDMLAGDDFKKNTDAKGVLMINIKRGFDFKMGDTAIPLIKDGGSDPYVSVGWAKFSKVLWSTRILISEMEPYWDETCFVLVTPQELNVDERLRIQLWDSDRMTADDDLGRIEVDLKQIMTDDRSNGRMWNREDGFRALKSGDNMPGKLDWSIGYFSKVRIQDSQFKHQTYDPEVRSQEQLEKKVQESSQRKLRELMYKEGRNEQDQSEFEQQKEQEMKEEQDAMIISAPPPDHYPSGLLSIQIHNITGLEVEQLSKKGGDEGENATEEQEDGEGMPSAYCMILINHRKTFKTRTKPQNSKPFYNAGCERFIRDWRDCEVYVAVRDARLDEDDPLLGMVHLSLDELFRERSQVMGYWPLAGGIGHGRIRLSLVWRSVQLQAPSSLLGWDYGTVDIQPSVSASDCPEDLRSCKLKFKTNISSGKMHSDSDNQQWKSKNNRNLNLAVQQRYASCMSIAFKKQGGLGDNTAAFCILWLKDIPDEDEQEVELPIWKGDFKRAKACCLDECGEKVGSIKLKLIFWAGMGSAHSAWASKNQNLQDVVEIIDTARDNNDMEKQEKRAGVVDEEVSSDSDSDSSDDGDDLPDGSAGDKQGPIDQVRDYKRRNKGLHRQHRGAMQWKIPRTAKWMKNKAGQAGNSVTDLFDRHSGGGGIETEV